MELCWVFLTQWLEAPPSPTPPSSTHLGGMTLEGTPVQLLSGHNQLHLTLVELECSAIRLESLSVSHCDYSLPFYEWYPTGVTVQVKFQFIADKESVNISFSLTCISTGGRASGVVWTRDGFLLHNTNPLVVTDASTLSYTNVLVVSDRAPGTYTCSIRGTSDQVLNSANFTVQGIVSLFLST
jgi:hypothetical protein